MYILIYMCVCYIRIIRILAIPAAEADVPTPTLGPPVGAFYDPNYTSDTWSLPFCRQLPRNKLGLTFHEEVIMQMSLDALSSVPPRCRGKMLAWRVC